MSVCWVCWPRCTSRRCCSSSASYSFAALVLVLALVGTGITMRSANPRQQPFVDAMIEKTVPYWRSLVRRVAY